MPVPTSEIRPPGVYTEPVEKQLPQLELGRTGVVGFVGITQRGPTNQAVRVTSIKQFYDIFGDLRDGFLAPAVEAFFRNGGDECYVVRVVHKQGARLGEVASKAAATIYAVSGRPSLFVEALSEGAWGNRVSVELTLQRPRAQTFLTLDAQPGDCSITVRSTHGLRPGTLVRLYNEETEVFRYVVAVEEKRLHWAEDSPLDEKLSATAPTYVEPVELQMRVSGPMGNEVFRDLSLHPASQSFIERVVQERSRMVRVRSLAGAPLSRKELPKEAKGVSLEGGLDGIDGIGPDDFIGLSGGPGERSGLFVLELVDEVDLLAVPDLMWLYRRNSKTPGIPFSTLSDVEVVQEAMISQCERLNDRFAILDSPFPDDIARTREYRLLFDTAHAALYFPWVVVEHVGKRKEVPPCGHVAGLMARLDKDMGVLRPPANEVLDGVQDLTMVVREEDVGHLNAEGINCLRAWSTRGIRVWGARTLSSDPQFRYVNVRRILDAINKSVRNGLQWVVFEPNVPSLWKTITRNVTQFLMTLWKQGYFTGGTPEEAFYVKCDEETNPPEVRDAGVLHVEIGVAPVRPAEYLVLRVAQEMQGPSSGP